MGANCISWLKMADWEAGIWELKMRREELPAAIVPLS